MNSHDIITFSPEILLIAFSMVAITLAAFSGDRFRTALSITYQVVLILGLVFLGEFDGSHEVLAFSDLLVFNGFTRFFKMTILGTLFFIQVAALPHLEKEGLHKPEFLALTAFAGVGYLLMVSSHHFITLFLAAELASFSTYLMVSFNRENLMSNEASLKYFVLGALSTSFFLLGVTFIYGALGTTSFIAIASALLTETSLPYIGTGIVLIGTAFAFKLSLVPFHMWTPDVYQGSPTPVTFFLTTIPKVATFAIFIRLSMDLFQAHISLWQPVMIGLAFLSMSIGSFAALFQSKIKRIIAYSTVSHMGYALLGLLSAYFQSIAAVLVYMVIYTITTVGIFSCLLCLKRQGKPFEDLEDFRGLGSEMPGIAGALMLFFFSLAGLPPLAGFFAKLAIFSAALEGGYTALVIVGVLSSVIAAGFYLKIIKMMYFKEPQGGTGVLLRVDSERTTVPLVVMGTALIIVLTYALFFNNVSEHAYKATKSIFQRSYS